MQNMLNILSVAERNIEKCEIFKDIQKKKLLEILNVPEPCYNRLIG